jgi:hypothetical protein
MVSLAGHDQGHRILENGRFHFDDDTLWLVTDDYRRPIHERERCLLTSVTPRHRRECRGFDFVIWADRAMTPNEWAGCDDPKPMLEFLLCKTSERKLRLFAVACFRRIAHLGRDRESRKAVDAAEAFADGRIREKKLDQARAAVGAKMVMYARAGWSTVEEYVSYLCAGAAQATAWPPNPRVFKLAELAAANAARWTSRARHEAEGIDEREVQAEFLREIVGDPFRAIALPPACRTPGVMALAQAVGRGDAFDRLPEFAAALAAAGCEDSALLAHCREPGPHLHGCWAVDAVLGRF